MPIAIDATVGSASANSFGTLAEADSYFASRIGGEAWLAETNDEKRKAALVTAAQVLDQENYRGKRATPDQALSWPRGGTWITGNPIPSDVVPTFVKKAQFEQALNLLVRAAENGGTADPFAPTGLEQFKSLGVGDIKLEMHERDAIPGNARAADDPSLTLAGQAYRFLRDYIITDINANGVGIRSFPIVR